MKGLPSFLGVSLESKPICLQPKHTTHKKEKLFREKAYWYIGLQVLVALGRSCSNQQGDE